MNTDPCCLSVMGLAGVRAFDLYILLKDKCLPEDRDVDSITIREIINVKELDHQKFEDKDNR